MSRPRRGANTKILPFRASEIQQAKPVILRKPMFSLKLTRPSGVSRIIPLRGLVHFFLFGTRKKKETEPKKDTCPLAKALSLTELGARRVKMAPLKCRGGLDYCSRTKFLKSTQR